MGSCCSNLSKNSGVLDKNQIHQKSIAVDNENKKTRLKRVQQRNQLSPKLDAKMHHLVKAKFGKRKNHKIHLKKDKKVLLSIKSLLRKHQNAGLNLNQKRKRNTKLKLIY
jgi:hypothetical protein